MKKIVLGCIAVVALVSSINVSANSGSTGDEAPKHTAEQLLKFSKKVELTLAEKGARVFMIGRKGRPASEMPEDIIYTHTALGVYRMITTEEGNMEPAYVIYNLYQRDDEPNVSDLITDFPIDFFSGAEQLQAGIVIPTTEVQKRLLAVIDSEVYKDLHVPAYSVIANPFDLEYQNCTEHTLDVINAAIYKLDDVQQIKANTKAYFKPQPVKVSGFKLMLGSLFAADVTTADHQGDVVTATFTTIANYLEDNDLVKERFLIEVDEATTAAM